MENFADGIFGDDAAGTTDAGFVAYFNMDVGPMDLNVTAEGLECGPRLAGLPSETATVGGTIEAGRVSYLFVLCDAPAG